MKPYLLRFQPVLKQTIWGGRRLGEQLGKSIGLGSDYAESWEIVDHGIDQSIVIDGPLAARSLSEITAEYPQWLLGDALDRRDPSTTPQGFPLLLKYLDCQRVLSVQVHPDDAYARTMQPPDRGKTEAWYIVASDPESLVYAGLKPGVDQAALREAMMVGQTDEVLHSFHPQAGDCLFIPAGTVHALGAGLLVAEIQQSSDTTFRLFDWNRVDERGHARTLHVEQSLEVADYEKGPIEPSRSEPMLVGWQTLVACEKFVFRSLEMGVARVGGDNRFHILSVPRGSASIESAECRLVLRQGESALLPAAHEAVEVAVSAESTLLEAHVPTATLFEEP